MPYNEILLAIHSFLMLVVTSMIAGFMIKQNKIMDKQNKIMDKQNKIMDKQNKIQQLIERPVLIGNWKIEDRFDTMNRNLSHLLFQIKKKSLPLYDISFLIKNVGRTPALNVEIKIINNKTGKILNPIGNHKFNHKFSVIPANDKVELSYPIEYILEPEYLFEQFPDKIKEMLQIDDLDNPNTLKVLALQELFKLEIITLKAEYQDGLGDKYTE